MTAFEGYEHETADIQIGVMGGAFQYTVEAITFAYMVGEQIAKHGCTLITGATTGVPYAAALGAKDNSGKTIGISPASSAEEHVKKYKKPLDGLDAIIFTGMGYNGREPINIASCDGIIYIGGEWGTLIEFGQGQYAGKVQGVLTNTGGVSDKIMELSSLMKTNHGAKIMYSTEPFLLVDSVIDEVKKRKNHSAAIYDNHDNLCGNSTDSCQDVRRVLSEIRAKKALPYMEN